jgi:hypothetical protein
MFMKEFPLTISIDDIGMILVKFENGVFGVLDYSWSRPKSFPVWGDVTESSDYVSEFKK